MIESRPKLPGENNRDYSYKVIKEAIMSLQLEPGRSISESELSEALQISRTPIREVMAKLREENLVEVIPQVGTYVSKIKPSLVEQAIFTRIIMEKEILIMSCKQFPNDKILELKKNIALQEQLQGKVGFVHEFHKLDNDFHAILFLANNKENIWEAINRLSTHYNRVRLMSEMKHDFDNAIAQHNIIVNIIENKKIDKVESIVRQHIIEPINLWEDLYEANSPYAGYFDLTFKLPVI
ncbi:GntR family transcriptional regulator [Evansella sp. AB-P1]|uniref:GntR family transcriptional regulator n=1 Tax=Evansella sp. AB-P1 TaxID=3037653 RepID=UPI00241ED5D5|nr:GntR family transcriptional regulator [Evansella sp. AB-P1]MDG5789736.1 GntR family transcriptional regulator [Evansella sp. AB-P1]